MRARRWGGTKRRSSWPMTTVSWRCAAYRRRYGNAFWLGCFCFDGPNWEDFNGKNKTRTSFRVFPFVLSTLSTEIITSFVFLAVVSIKESRIQNKSDKKNISLFFLRRKETKAPGENEFLVFNLKQFRSLSLLQSRDFFFLILRSEIATHPPLHVNETHSAHIKTHTRKSAPEKEKLWDRDNNEAHENGGTISIFWIWQMNAPLIVGDIFQFVFCFWRRSRRWEMDVMRFG